MQAMTTDLTKPEMTRQEMFDTAARGVIAQGRASCQGYGCLYRLKAGGKVVAKCGVGHLIPDELYDQEMEGFSVQKLQGRYPGLLRNEHDLLRDIQRAHAGAAIVSAYGSPFLSSFRKRMRDVACTHGLDASVLDE